MESRPDALTVVVRRTVQPGRESAFEDAMRTFIAETACFAGSEAFHVVRPTPPSREYLILHRFSSLASRREFVATESYAAWMRRLRDLCEADPEIEEREGLALWFTLPGRSVAPPRWKMALVTFLGVYPLTSVLPRTFGGWLPGVHPLLVNVFATGSIVALLTWVVMPFLTRTFAGWLFRSESGTERSP